MEEFWIKCLENGDIEKIVTSLKEVNSYGMDSGYYFIKNINDLYENGLCSKEKLDKANMFYLQKLKIIPSDY
jgi:hypothetical protein